MIILYDLIFLIVAIIYLPVYLFRRKFHRGFWARLGFIQWQASQERPIWIHAVSVGEAVMMRSLIAGLKKTYPGKKMVISTVTVTGNRIAQTLASDNDLVTYLPLDFSFIVRNVIDKTNPDLFILAETEIWPNLISCLHKKNIPVIVVNGRISDASFKGYLLIRFLLRGILNKISLFCVQTERDAQRLLKLGVAEKKVKVTGNMKFDIIDASGAKSSYAELRKKLNLNADDKLLIAASTHPGEEEIVVQAYQDLLKDYPNLRLLIAPRHPERTKDVESLINKFGFTPLKISKLNLGVIEECANLRHSEAEGRRISAVFILDTIGHLMDYYAISDIVFVGGSLVKTGGHNILEPASLEKPIIIGPHMFNFRDISELFLSNQAAILAADKEQLREKVKYLLDNPAQAQKLSRRAKELIGQNQGATNKAVDLIKGIYERTAL